MERPLDIHHTVTLAPPPPSADGAEDLGPADRRNTPVGGDASSAHMQAALAASNRTDESLNELMRSIQELARGVGGAREANEHLVQELETLREMLGSANEQRLALRNRLTVLEQEHRSDRKRAAADASYQQEQYDAFLSDLLDDHEQATDELKRERDTAHRRIAELEARLLSLSTQSPPSSKPTSRGEVATMASDAAMRAELAQLKSTVDRLTQERERTREALQRLQVQRDEAQAQAAKAVRERDAALAGADDFGRASSHPGPLRHSNVPLSARPTDPPPPTVPRPTATRPTGPTAAPQPAAAQPAVTRRPVLELELDVGPSPRRSSPSPEPQAPRVSKPPLRQKPDPISRPLIGYSVKDSVAPESLGSSPRHSKPPKS
jgi:hypothetical protein